MRVEIYSPRRLLTEMRRLGRPLCLLCVALDGLALLVGLERALVRIHPQSALTASAFLAVYALIVWGIIEGLTSAGEDTTRKP